MDVPVGDPYKGRRKVLKQNTENGRCFKQPRRSWTPTTQRSFGFCFRIRGRVSAICGTEPVPSLPKPTGKGGGRRPPSPGFSRVMLGGKGPFRCPNLAISGPDFKNKIQRTSGQCPDRLSGGQRLESPSRRLLGLYPSEPFCKTFFYGFLDTCPCGMLSRASSGTRQRMVLARE